MESVPVFVGLDYHSKSVQACVVDSAGKVLANWRCGNSEAEFLGVMQAGWRVERAAIKSWFGAADLADCLRGEPGWPLTLAHPGYVAPMKHNPDKSN